MKKSIICLLMIAFFLTGCGVKTESEIGEIIGTTEMNTDYYQASFVVDVEDLSQVTTLAKYIFVGTVEEYIRTESDPEDELEVYTFYSVKVIENIKGQLIQDANIEVKKAGGYVKSEDYFIMCEGDILPKVGGTYVFAAVMFEEDGSIYCFGPNTVAEIENAENYKEDEKYLSYMEASKTIAKDVPDNGWSTSRYDVLYEE